MASFLRQIVAGPRTKHQETGLDLCYVTSDIIATSVAPFTLLPPPKPTPPFLSLLPIPSQPNNILIN